MDEAGALSLYCVLVSFLKIVTWLLISGTQAVEVMLPGSSRYVSFKILENKTDLHFIIATDAMRSVHLHRSILLT